METPSDFSSVDLKLHIVKLNLSYPIPNYRCKKVGFHSKIAL